MFYTIYILDVNVHIKLGWHRVVGGTSKSRIATRIIQKQSWLEKTKTSVNVNKRKSLPIVPQFSINSNYVIPVANSLQAEIILVYGYSHSINK